MFLFLLLISAADATLKFACENGDLIDYLHTCNGTAECLDASDEHLHLCKNVICTRAQFRCIYGACISKSLKCNGKNDCVDGSDESQCAPQAGSCNVNEFKCNDGQCVPFDRLCQDQPMCKDKSDKRVCNKVVCPLTMHRCKFGGCIYTEDICNGQNDCVDGSDEADLLCRQEKANSTLLCPPLNLTRVSATCKVPLGAHKGMVPCSKPMPVGTIVTYKCNPYYVPVPRHRNNEHMVCQADGTWSKEPLKCDPDCGIVSGPAVPLITHGWYPERTQHPWHAILFVLQDGKWEFSCGGSLISERIVLTAAHCTWELSNDMLRVGLGKHFSDYYKKEHGAEFRNVSQVVTQPLYQDLIGNYGSDLAILVLDRAVQFGTFIIPICIDWRLDDITDHLDHNSLGLIVGSGITESNTYSQQIRAIYLPVVNDENCIMSQDRDFKKYITFTSFCAGWANGTSVCNGDSGGGLVFSSPDQPNRYTLQGIVSVSPRRPGTSFCDPNFYTIFTKVGIYVEWIFKVLKEIHQDDLYDLFENNVIV